MPYQSNVPAVKRAMTEAELRALERIGSFVDGVATDLCPVGQYDDGRVGGNLRSRLTYRVDPAAKSVTNGTVVEYAPFVEFGTGQRGAGSGVTPPADYQYGGRPGMAAQPYLTPAYEGENMARIRALAAEELGKLSGSGLGSAIGVGGGPK